MERELMLMEELRDQTDDYQYFLWHLCKEGERSQDNTDFYEILRIFSAKAIAKNLAIKWKNELSSTHPDEFADILTRLDDYDTVLRDVICSDSARVKQSLDYIEHTVLPRLKKYLDGTEHALIAETLRDEEEAILDHTELSEDTQDFLNRFTDVHHCINALKSMNVDVASLETAFGIIKEQFRAVYHLFSEFEDKFNIVRGQYTPSEDEWWLSWSPSQVAQDRLAAAEYIVQIASDECPLPSLLGDYVFADIPERKTTLLRSHIESCPTCNAIVDSLTKDAITAINMERPPSDLLSLLDDREELAQLKKWIEGRTMYKRPPIDLESFLQPSPEQPSLSNLGMDPWMVEVTRLEGITERHSLRKPSGAYQDHRSEDAAIVIRKAPVLRLPLDKTGKLTVPPTDANYITEDLQALAKLYSEERPFYYRVFEWLQDKRESGGYQFREIVRTREGKLPVVIPDLVPGKKILVMLGIRKVVVQKPFPEDFKSEGFPGVVFIFVEVIAPNE